MSRLEMLGQREEGGELAQQATFMPGEGSGPITNNFPNGEKEMWRVRCLPGGLSSVVEKTSKGIGVAFAEAGQPLSGGKKLEWEIVRVLKSGEHFDVQLRTDFNPFPRTVRFAQR